MKRLIILISIILIASAGLALSGCKGGGAIELPGAADTVTTSEGAAEATESAGSAAIPTGGAACDPVVITNTVIEVVGGDEKLAAGPEGQTCLMSRVPDDVSFVFSVLKNARDIVVAVQNVIPASEKEALEPFMMPFNELGLEEVVGFAKLKYVDSIVDEPSGDCRDCVKNACPSCLGEAEALCNSFSPPPGNIERCAWELASPENPIADCANNCVGQCMEKCTEEKPEPESFGFLVRWVPRGDDADGAIKFADLRDFVEGVNRDNLDKEIKKWHERCDSDPITCNNNSDFIPTELEPSKKMEIEQIDSTIALVHSTAKRPDIVEPVRICKFIRFDGIRTRPAVYGELFDMKLIMKIKSGEPLTEGTMNSRKIAAGIDLRENFYRLYAGVVDKQTLATGAFLSSVVNLGDGFGLELWKQMMTTLVKN